MPARVYVSDLATTTLSTGGPDLATGALSLTVVSNAGFPTSGSFFTVEAPTGEHITVTSGIGTTTWGGLIRGDNGTTAKIAAIPNGAILEEVFGARDGNNFAQVGDPGLTNVRSIKKTGAAALTGDVTLTGGTNVTLTQSGNDISIAATGGGGGGSGTVTSVAMTVPGDQSVSGSPVTASGTFAVTDNAQNANTVKAGPTTGSPASPAYRLLTATDIPAATTTTRGAMTLATSTPVADGTGAVGGSTAAARADHVHPLVTTFTAEVTVPDLKVTGLTGSVQAMRVVGATTSGAPTTGPHLIGDAALSLADATWHVCTVAGTPGTFVAASGSGTVTSVGLTVPGALLGVSGSPITSSGTLAISLLTQSANTVLAGPTSGSPSTPTVRSLVTADFPASGVAAGSYGDGTHVPAVTVDATGRLTAVSSTLITGSGFANPMTSAGDLIVGGSSGTPGRLGVGASNQVLTVSPATSLPVWQSASTNVMTTAGDLIYEAGGGDVALGLPFANWSASAHDFTNPADLAGDGSDATYVYYGAGVAGWWLEVDLGAAQTCGSMRLFQAALNITAYQLQGWNGSSWDVVATRGTVSNPDIFTFTEATYQLWRILTTTVSGAPNVASWNLYQATAPARLAAPSGIAQPRLGMSGSYPAWVNDAPVSTKTANYSILTTDHKTLFLANAASLVFTLPAPATAGAGFEIEIKNKNQTTTGLKTNTAGVLIDGVDCSSTACTTGLTTAYGFLKVKTDGTAWYTV